VNTGIYTLDEAPKAWAQCVKSNKLQSEIFPSSASGKLNPEEIVMVTRAYLLQSPGTITGCVEQKE
jgi:hypothetical protein